MFTALALLCGATVAAWMAHRVRRAGRRVDEILREELDPPGRPTKPDPQRQDTDRVA